MRRIFPALLSLLLGLTATDCKEPQTHPAAKPGHHLLIKGDTLWVEIASEPGERERGLMFRESLAPDSGMLFVFEDKRILSFWMRNTSVPLSVAFLDENWIIVDTQDMEPLSDRLHFSRKPAQYAIEANQGWFKARGIGPGDTVLFR
ncbi:MAG: DUF192 domain-containing protein [candidate division WOR-3 bacterium]